MQTQMQGNAVTYKTCKTPSDLNYIKIKSFIMKQCGFIIAFIYYLINLIKLIANTSCARLILRIIFMILNLQ